MERIGVKRYSLSKQVADELESRIEAGEYQVGQKIPTEIELMEMYNVSRNTIREAVQSLVSAGVLVVKQGDGTYVKSNNRFDANMNRKFMQVTEKEILEAHNAIEIAIVQFAARRRTQEDLDKIREAFRVTNQRGDSLEFYLNADLKFHLAIAEASHNKILEALYRSMLVYIEKNIKESLTNVGDLREITQFHDDLYHAIVEQDATKARRSVLNILNLR